MTKTEQDLLSMNSTMTEADLQDAVGLSNASFVQVIFSCAFLAPEYPSFSSQVPLFPDWWIHGAVKVDLAPPCDFCFRQ